MVLHQLFLAQFKVKARSLQIEAALTLSQMRDTFLLASTGYGKYLVPDAFLSLFFNEASHTSAFLHCDPSEIDITYSAQNKSVPFV